MMEEEPPERGPWVVLGFGLWAAMLAGSLGAELRVPVGNASARPAGEPRAPASLRGAAVAPRRARAPAPVAPVAEAPRPWADDVPQIIWVVDTSCSMNAGPARAQLLDTLWRLDEVLPEGRRVSVRASTSPQWVATWTTVSGERPALEHAIEQLPFRGITPLADALGKVYDLGLPEGSEVWWVGERHWMGRLRRMPDPSVAERMRARGVRTSVALWGPPGRGPSLAPLDAMVVAGGGRFATVEDGWSWRIVSPGTEAGR